MSTFRELAKSYKSNLKLTPNDKEPLELIDVVASTRTLTKEYNLDDRIFLNTPESRAFLDLESKRLAALEYELNGRVHPEIKMVSIRGEVSI